jgi:prepilin-type N-terminal cleavage/methylation domain-containing protein
MKPTRPRNATRSQAGFTLLETIIAALILVVLAAAIVSAGLKSRYQIDYEEVRRRAIAIGQERFETIRAQFRYDDIDPAVIDTTITLDGATYDLDSHMTLGADSVLAAPDDSLEDYVKFVTNTVSWTARGASGQTVRRKVVMSTYFFRGL